MRKPDIGRLRSDLSEAGVRKRHPAPDYNCLVAFIVDDSDTKGSINVRKPAVRYLERVILRCTAENQCHANSVSRTRAYPGGRLRMIYSCQYYADGRRGMPANVRA
jgi:hypothetical protein